MPQWIRFRRTALWHGQRRPSEIRLARGGRGRGIPSEQQPGGGQRVVLRVVRGPHLPDKSDGWLVEALLLRVPDVGGDHSVEGETAGNPALFELDAVLFCLDGKLASDGILHVEDGRVERVDGQRVHRGSREQTRTLPTQANHRPHWSKVKGRT